jgi:hypothetical protein
MVSDRACENCGPEPIPIGMKQAPGGLGGWRWTFLSMGLVSLLMAALPAQAGLGDLVDDLLDPVEDAQVVGGTAEIVDDVVAPLAEDIVQPVAGDLVDPVVDEVPTTTVTTVVPPVVDDTTTPVSDIAIAPVTETIPPVVTTTTTTIRVTESAQEEAARESIDIRSKRPLIGLETALALQMTLVDGSSTQLSELNVDQPASENLVGANWLDGLTSWLRNSTDGLVKILALPIRLLEVLARALMTAGSGLIAPLSMLLAFTALLIKDRQWLRPCQVRVAFRAVPALVSLARPTTTRRPLQRAVPYRDMRWDKSRAIATRSIPTTTPMKAV